MAETIDDKPTVAADGTPSGTAASSNEDDSVAVACSSGTTTLNAEASQGQKDEDPPCPVEATKTVAIKRTVKRRKKNKRPAGMPTRPLSAYNVFFKKERVTWLEEYRKSDGPKDKSSTFKSMGKHIGQRWKKLAEEERKPFVKVASEDMIRYRREVEEFNRRQMEARSKPTPNHTPPVAATASASAASTAPIDANLYTAIPSMRELLHQQALMPVGGPNPGTRQILQASHPEVQSVLLVQNPQAPQLQSQQVLPSGGEFLSIPSSAPTMAHTMEHFQSAPPQLQLGVPQHQLAALLQQRIGQADTMRQLAALHQLQQRQQRAHQGGVSLVSSTSPVLQQLLLAQQPAPAAPAPNPQSVHELLLQHQSLQGSTEPQFSQSQQGQGYMG